MLTNLLAKRLLILAFLLCMGAAAHASTGYYVVSIYESEGEKSVDFRWWARDANGRTVSAPDIGIAYGVNKRWYSEIYLSYIKPPGIGQFWRDVTWQNDVLLTQGQLPVDIALHTNLVDYRDPARGLGLEIGPIVQTDFGRTNVNAGLLFERDYRTSTANTMQMRYQWQLRHRWIRQLHVGAMGFGELGAWDHWDSRAKQSHRAGPALFGTFDFSGQSLKYEASVLFGKISGAHSNALSLRLQSVF